MSELGSISESQNHSLAKFLEEKAMDTTPTEADRARAIVASLEDVFRIAGEEAEQKRESQGIMGFPIGTRRTTNWESSRIVLPQATIDLPYRGTLKYRREKLPDGRVAITPSSYKVTLKHDIGSQKHPQMTYFGGTVYKVSCDQYGAIQQIKVNTGSLYGILGAKAGLLPETEFKKFVVGVVDVSEEENPELYRNLTRELIKMPKAPRDLKFDSLASSNDSPRIDLHYYDEEIDSFRSYVYLTYKCSPETRLKVLQGLVDSIPVLH